MQRKLKDYCKTGTNLVWYVDPQSRTVQVFTGPTKPKVLQESHSLDGGTVLPGFTLSHRELFAEPGAE